MVLGILPQSGDVIVQPLEDVLSLLALRIGELKRVSHPHIGVARERPAHHAHACECTAWRYIANQGLHLLGKLLLRDGAAVKLALQILELGLLVGRQLYRGRGRHHHAARPRGSTAAGKLAGIRREALHHVADG